MDENEVGFSDFADALFDGENHDTGSSESTNEEPEASETTAEDAQEIEEGAEGAENSDNENTDESENDGSEAEAEPDNKDESQKFTYKVNKEERSLDLSNEADRETAKELMQKGSDYDRVKEQSAQRQQTIDQLTEQVSAMSKNQNAIDVLELIAQKSGSTMDELTESLYVNFRKSGGVSEDAAREELKNARLTKELNAVKAQQEQQSKKPPQEENEEPAHDPNEDRFEKDMAIFREIFPDVKMTNELAEKLVPDIKKGMSLAAAYRKYEKAKEDAKKQNAKNKRSSPGSQKDSGGRTVKSDYETFKSALFG